MAELVVQDLPQPTLQERRLAAIMHLATIPAPIWGPLVGLAIGHRSRYLRAHALQSLFETLLLNIALGIAMVCSFIYTLTRLWHFYQTNWEGFSLTEFLVRFLIGWTVLGLLAVVNALLAVKAAKRANEGVWPRRRK